MHGLAGVITELIYYDLFFLAKSEGGRPTTLDPLLAPPLPPCTKSEFLVFLIETEFLVL